MITDQPLKTKDITENQDTFLDYALSHDFGDLHFKVDTKTGMKAIIAIHSTKLGPALGGCRFIEYADNTQAIYDAMRLARGMSYKSALVNLPIGGGKSVIIKPRGHYDHKSYFHNFGKFVNELGGRYITALDSGTQLADMDIIAQETSYVASLSSHNGDPSPSTVQGIIGGIKTAVEFKLGKHELEGLHIAIQGLGHVGYLIAQHLHGLGVRLSVADIDPVKVARVVKEFGANATDISDIHKISCDVFTPCALGAIINDTTINQLQTKIIAGAANNQLAHAYHGQKLHDMGILYATDYVINAGGLIFAANKYFHNDQQSITPQINAINLSLRAIFDRSMKENRSTSDIADTMAREKLA